MNGYYVHGIFVDISSKEMVLWSNKFEKFKIKVTAGFF